MRIKELIDILEQLPQELEIYIAVLGSDNEASGQIRIEPVTESYADMNVIGYMITDQQNQEVH